VDREQFIRTIVRRIVVGQDSLDILIGQDSFESALLNQTEGEGDGIIQLGCAIKTSRRGNEMRLVIQSERLPNVSIISSDLKSLARGPQWLDLIVDGECSSYRDIAKRTGLTESFINRTLKYALLPIETQEAVVNRVR
jgi:hypothetical protein